MPCIRWAAACVALATVVGVAGAQDTARVTTLDTITVTAVRTRAVAPPVVTVTVQGERIREIQPTSPWDLVRRLTGIEVHEQGQGPGFASDAVLRGFTSDHSSDVLFVVDGVPLNLPVHGHVEGYADWNVLVAPAVAEMRVMHGPASPRYGDFAFGGVVEAVTDVSTTGSSAAVHGSSWKDAGAWVRTGTSGPLGGALLVLDAMRHQGWRQHSAFWRGNVLLRGWRQIGRAQLDGGVTAYGSEWDSPGFLSVEQYNAGDLKRGGDPTDEGHATRWIGHVHLVAPAGGAGLHATTWAQVARSDIYLNLPEDGVLRQTFERDRRVALGGRAELVFAAAGGDATAGMEGRYDDGTYDLDHTVGQVFQEPLSALDGRYVNAALYTRWRRLVAGRLVLDLGARLDGLRYGSTDRRLGTPHRASASVLVSPKLGARYFLASNVVVLGSWSRGFRGAPGVIEVPDRPPMTANAAEVGVQVLAGPLRAHLAAFRIDVDNERIQDPVTREISDAGASVRQGLTADLELAMGTHLSAFLVGTFNDARISGTVDPMPQVIRLSRAGPVPRLPEFHLEPLEPGDPVPSVSRWTGRVGLDAHVTDVKGRAVWRFNGPFTPIGERDITTQSYGVFDVNAVIPMGGVVSAYVDVVNVFNTRYPEVRASGFLNPGMLRTLRVALRIGEGPAPAHH